jgi:hypothetical protein
MASKTEIINLALVKIGQQPIRDTTPEDSNSIRLSNVFWGQCVDETLANCPEDGWKFARQRVNISADVTAPAFAYDYQYHLPADFVTPVSVQVAGTDITDWVREGDYLLTNEEDEEIDLVYIKRIEDTAKYPPHFVKALYYSLAVQLAFNLSGNDRMANSLLNELEVKIIPRAWTADSKSKYVKEFNNDWQEAGRSGANTINSD